MTPERVEDFHVCLLQQLRAVGCDSSLPIRTLTDGARSAGYKEANDDMVRSAMAYLIDAEFCARVMKSIQPENRRYRITKKGIDFLAEEGR